MRALVAVSSRHGSTHEMGEILAEELEAAGVVVDQVPPDDVESVHDYDAVVLGSAVYVGRLSPGLRDLVKRQGPMLRDRPTWLFWSGPVGDPPLQVTVPEDVDALASSVAPREVRCFVGALDRGGLDLSERALVALTRAREGDYRDLDAVRSWGRSIAAEVTGRRRPGA